MNNFESPNQNQKYSRHKGYLKWELANKDVNGGNDLQQNTPDNNFMFRDKQAKSLMIPAQASSQVSLDQSTIQDHSCCDKLDELSKQYQQKINEQMGKLMELNKLIQQHSKLLVDFYNTSQQDGKSNQAREQQINDNNKLLRDRDRQLQEWEDKYNQEKAKGQEKDEEIKDLEAQIKELSSKIVVTTTSTEDIQNEVNQWKNKFIALNKQFNEAEQKLVVVENEIDMLKQQSTKKTTTESRSSIRRKTLNKDIPQP